MLKLVSGKLYQFKKSYRKDLLIGDIVMCVKPGNFEVVLLNKKGKVVSAFCLVEREDEFLKKIEL